MKIFCAAFMCLQFGFVIFWRKDFGAKAAHKMLVKLTLGYQSSVQFHDSSLFLSWGQCYRTFLSVIG
jgi:hypothetical protein